MSRTPIREAIRKLELEGLVLMIPRKGAEVAKISEKSLRDVLEVRRSLEELAIELACERMEAEDLRRLEQCQENFCRAIRSGSPMEMAESDEAFHDVIYQSTGNEKLVQMLNNLREQMYRYRLEYIKDADKRQVLMVEHEHILSALKVRNLAEPGWLPESILIIRRLLFRKILRSRRKMFFLSAGEGKIWKRRILRSVIWQGKSSLKKSTGTSAAGTTVMTSGRWQSIWA